jgi:hypothetical protein
MKELNSNLIADLARLVAKYGPEEWTALLEHLEDERRRVQIATLLRELAASSQSTKDKASRGDRQPSRAPAVREALKRLRGTDPEKAGLLEDVWIKLRNRELLPTMTMVRAFAEAVGIKGLSSPRREQAVTELMEQLIDMPDGTLGRMTQLSARDDPQLAEEYERWVALILDRGKL